MHVRDASNARGARRQTRWEHVGEQEQLWECVRPSWGHGNENSLSWYPGQQSRPELNRLRQKELGVEKS